MLQAHVAQPVYEALFGYHVFGLGFVTSMAFIIGTGLPFSMPMLFHCFASRIMILSSCIDLRCQ